MIYIAFLVVAIIVCYGAMKLASYAEDIEANSTLNPTLVGAILAISTSLPEVASSVTAIAIGNSQVAISNPLGSNIFNLTILAIMNFIFAKKIVSNHINKKNNYINFINILIYIIILFAIHLSDIPYLSIFNFSIFSFGIVLVYVIGMKYIGEEEQNQEEKKDPEKFKKSVILFLCASIIVLIAGMMLSLLADKIILISGLNASFVGATFIGVSTSLPELISAYILIKRDNINMAAAGILGSTLFNFTIISLCDLISKTMIFEAYDGIKVLIYLGMFFSILTIISIKIKWKNKFTNLIIPASIIAMYFGYVLLGNV